MTAEFQKRLRAWFDAHQRRLPWRETRDPYAIWVSEVMLQQTQVNTVIPYYHRFLERFPDLYGLAQADLQTVLKVWEGLGYYARARNLHKAAGVVASENGGRIPSDWHGFCRLPGVGEYIAAAVLSIAFDRPLAVVDGNVKRVLARLLRIGLPVNRTDAYPTFKTAAEELLNRKRPGQHNQALMELGALICRPVRPDCALCPVAAFCQACLNAVVADFPKRLASPRVSERRSVVGVVWKNERLLIVQRPPQGLLGGLWELPGGEGESGARPADKLAAEIQKQVNLTVRIESRLGRIRHVYTHFRLWMDVYACHYVSGRVDLRGPTDFRWVKPLEMERFPLHKAVHKVLPLIDAGVII